MSGAKRTFADYEMVVGLEVHVQLLTRTKAFCSCSTAYGSAPNANTCPVCLALPGALPVLNEEAVRLAVIAAHALEATVNETSIFARKNYFYPDLPKGYQISQFDKPLAEHGKLVIGSNADGTPITVRVTRVHMEEDAGKSVHDRYPGVTAIDLNRSGVPLIEIVSEPDMRSSVEAGAYLRALKQVIEYTGVSDANMEEGSLRVDANVSARLRGETKLGTKTEVKNLNSFSGVERALEVEFAHQVEALIEGGEITQQTMLWDATRGEVRPARSKEGSHDYRYFPEPDLPPLQLARAWIDQSRISLPELPNAKRTRFATVYMLPPTDIEVLTANPPTGAYFESVVKEGAEPKAAANWVIRDVLQEVKGGASIDAFPVEPSSLAKLIGMVADNTVSSAAAKTIFAIAVKTRDLPADIAKREGLLQERNEDALAGWVDQVLAENPDVATRFRAGDKKLLGVLVGLVMKASKGRADPKAINQLLSARAAAGE
ncbi:MAG: Asp-tRNA(Asn)/Glu-tRNA(Gln) amidotransferase subunit GatB [Gemmatimonadaceae bacterium]|nr:Asp-tRNA(Asn)/Glu-tRNA(Gln) amidotransferase subunit GatB [Gemmatimonadaceae bacterium]